MHYEVNLLQRMHLGIFLLDIFFILQRREKINLGKQT